jgi:gliding motility-associated-like protein
MFLEYLHVILNLVMENFKISMRLGLIINLFWFFTGNKLGGQIDSNRYDMISSNLTFLDIPTNGTYQEVYNISNYSTPFVVEYSGNKQTSSNSLFATANSVYSAAGNVSNVYYGSDHQNPAGLYSTKTYDLTKNDLKLRARFYNRGASSGGEHNEYWMGFIPSTNKYYHPIASEAGGNTGIGVLIGGWPTFWNARNRKSDTQADYFFQSNTNTTLQWATWYEVTVLFGKSNDSFLIKKFDAVDSKGNKYTLSKPLFIGKSTDVPYASAVRAVYCVDDLLDWIEVIEIGPEQCKLSIDKINGKCDVTADTLDLNQFVKKNNKLISPSEASYLVVSAPSGSSLLNKKLINGKFPPAQKAGIYKIFVSIGCDSGTVDYEIFAKPQMKITLSDSVLCVNHPKVTVNAISSNYSPSQLVYNWEYLGGAGVNIKTQGSNLLFTLSNQSDSAKIKLVATTLKGCKDSTYTYCKFIDTATVKILTTDKCFPNDAFFSIESNQNINYFTNLSWKFSDGYTSDALFFKRIPNASGQFKVSLSLTDSNGCGIKLPPVPYYVHARPEGTINLSEENYDSDRSIVNGIAIVPDSISIKWFGPNNHFISSSKSIRDTHLLNNRYCYKLVMMNRFGCMDSLQKCLNLVKVFKEEYYIPNAFTPFSSDYNNVFAPYFSDRLDQYRIRIYDRWGEKIFDSEDQYDYWKGDFMGKEVPAGNYIYVIKGQFPSKKIINEKGTIMVLD